MVMIFIIKAQKEYKRYLRFSEIPDPLTKCSTYDNISIRYSLFFLIILIEIPHQYSNNRSETKPDRIILTTNVPLS